ncbi:hypothetical protein LNY03_28815, partial [Pseudomonas nitroreducens]
NTDLMSDQYFFDPHQKRITDMPEIALVHKRASIIAMLGFIANDNSLQILHDLIAKAPCRRVREAALVAISNMANFNSSDKDYLYRIGASD